MDPTASSTTNDGLTVSTFYLECLAQASYLIAHEGNAFIIDPRRDIEIYRNALSANNLTLRGVMETHLHADFVSGHLEMHKSYGVPVFISHNAGAKFPHYGARDGDVFALSSKYGLKPLETPGHTFGCITWVLYNLETNAPLKAFTGDTLFVGGVGRPDLVGALDSSATPEMLSANMYNSLYNKLMLLNDNVEVLPAHGPGSPCGKGISAELSSTIGKEKASNPALQFDNEQDFIAFNIAGLGQAPQYFPNAVMTNLQGAKQLEDEVAAVHHLTPEAFEKQLSKHVVVLDTRGADPFAAGHIKDSLNIPLGEGGGVKLEYEDGNFAIWVGTLISPNASILLVTPTDKEVETVKRLGRIGYATQVKGVLHGGIKAWQDSSRDVASYTRSVLPDVVAIEGLQNDPSTVIVDARTAGEFNCAVRGHLIGAVNLPLGEINQAAQALDASKRYVVYCLGGFRSTITTSIMRQHGLDAVDIVGGYERGVLDIARCHTTAQGACTKSN
eukprot:TRINITY_DN12186_c2_g3_i1.p1 TRINITY_DN12186_c2_g3~~TRINITY_DN12186_c2_g3_i1.p1  ORF type:complete len:501 (+),score=102.92 TRINITY_DN12186_c2_g3_i1:117-1619(+)